MIQIVDHITVMDNCLRKYVHKRKYELFKFVNKTKCNVHFRLKRYWKYLIHMLLDIKNLGKQR